MPPEAITGTLLASAMAHRKSRLGPVRVPSVAMSVQIRAANGLVLKRWASALASVPLSSIQPRVATLPFLASMPTTIRPGWRAARASTNSGCSSATVPRITRSSP